MVKISLWVVFVLFYGLNAFAADGDLTVKGDLNVGEPGNPSTLGVEGTFSITMTDGDKYTFQYMNLGEDSAKSFTAGDIPDTCDGNKEAAYTDCPPDVAKQCYDVKSDTDDDVEFYYVNRLVTCKKAVTFVLQ